MIRLLNQDTENCLNLYLVNDSKNISQMELLVTRYTNTEDNETLVAHAYVSYRNHINIYQFVTTADFSLWMLDDIEFFIKNTLKCYINISEVEE